MSPSSSTSRKQLLAELTENNDFFDMLVDMIPSKLYIAGHSGDDYNPKNPYYRGVTADSKEARKAAAKVAKRRKLDPHQAESTVDKKGRLEKSGSPQKPGKAAAASPQQSQNKNQSRIESLRAKLHAKLAEKQGQRPSNPDQVSKRAARRAEKRKRQEEAAKRKKLASTKVTETAAAHYKMAAAAHVAPAQDLEHLDYGRLAGLNAHRTSENYAKSNKALANLSKTKNLQKMLQDAEAKRQKLQALKQGSEADKAQAAALQWADTLKEADGQRVKDDPAKIKKALKRKAAKKSKSQKAWKARMEQTSETAKSRQKVRQHNLAARKEGGATGANLSKKKIAEPETTRDGGRRLSRAGFEGKKREFLNSPKEHGKNRKKTTTSQ